MEPSARPLLVGMAPGPNTDPQLPLFPIPSTSAGGRLQKLTGLTRGQYLKTFDRVNLLYHFPGKYPGTNEDRWPRERSRLAADTMRQLLPGRSVILVGRNVAHAFGHKADFMVWEHHEARRRDFTKRCDGLCRMAVIPHPSGRNRLYNSAENRQAIKNFFAEFLSQEGLSDSQSGAI